MIREQTQQNFESFYSINNTKSQFTFIQEQQQVQAYIQAQQQATPINVQNILYKFDIRQSSAVQLQSSNLLNQSFRSIASKQSKTMNLHDISAIDANELNQLECSMCLQHQIDCLSVPQQISPDEMKNLHSKMDKLKHEQSLLKKQINLFQETIVTNQLRNSEMAAQVMQVNKFIKKKCDHDSQSSQPFNIPAPDNRSQVTLKKHDSASAPKEQKLQRKKHFDIKPNRGQSASQKQANAKYKQCSFNNEVTLIQDKSNQFRLDLKYDNEVLIITVTNFQKGETNFIHAARVNQPQFVEKISQKIYFPLKGHSPKKFTLSLSIMLLIFEQGNQKQQSNLIKIQQIRAISIPLPINYFIENRFTALPKNDELLTRLMQKLYFYEIDINYNADYAAYKLLKQFVWVSNKWISLRGSQRLIYVEIDDIKEIQSGFGVVFKIACKEKDRQQVIDIIQYLCFILAV